MRGKNAEEEEKNPEQTRGEAKKCGGYAQAKDDSKKYNVREMRRTRTMEAAMMLSIEKDDEHVPTNAPVSPVANQKQK